MMQQFMRLNEIDRSWNWIDDGVLPYALAAMRAVWLWLGLKLWAHLFLPPRSELVPLPIMFGLLALSTFFTQLAIFRLRDARGTWLVVGGGVFAAVLTLYVSFGASPFQDFGALFITIVLIAWCWRWGILAGREPIRYDTYARNFLYGVIAIALVVFGALLAHTLAPAELIFPILAFFALGLGILALASLRDAQQYERATFGQSFRLNRFWLGTVALVVFALVLIGFIVGGFFVPAWAARVVDAFVFVWRAVTGVLLIVVYIVALVFFGILDVLGRVIHLTPNQGEPMQIPEPPRLDEIFKNQDAATSTLPPELVLLAQILAVVLLALALAIIFAIAFRRWREYATEDADETRESVFSFDLLQAQLRNLFRGKTQAQNATAPFAEIRGDDARAQIRRVYQELLAWAAQRGVTRSAGQTPREFERALAAQFETRAEQLALITDEYVNARYSSEPIRAQNAERVLRAWQEFTVTANEK